MRLLITQKPFEQREREAEINIAQPDIDLHLHLENSSESQCKVNFIPASRSYNYLFLLLITARSRTIKVQSWLNSERLIKLNGHFTSSVSVCSASQSLLENSLSFVS